MILVLSVIGALAVTFAICSNISYAPALRDENGKRIPKTDRNIAELIAIDVNGSNQWISIRGQNVDVPVLLVAGRFDYNTPCTLAEEYCTGLQSPEKKFVWFEHCAHSPCFEDPGKFSALLTDFFPGK